MDDLVGSKAPAAITTTNKKRPRRMSRNQTHQPQDSMKDVVGSKMEAEAAVITTTNKKRPRRVRPTKSKPKEEEESLKEVDIEDLGFCGNEILEIRAFLLEWYDRNQRDLPWRRICRGDDEDGSDKRAYAVWVSEVMLQQTRVQTVIDYFNRWMHKWPTICHLARASIEEVNEMWAGLGYYRRARYLLEGSKKIVEGGGVFPKTVAALRKVPGIGDYTAGAIASIAFNEAVPVVDGNVIRVVARLKAISANPKESVTIKNFWKLAGQLVDPSRPRDFNQALMELGATVCTPLNPNCSVCPVSNHCHALSLAKQNKSAQVTDYPTKVIKSKKRHEFSAVSVVEILDGQDMIEELQPDGRFLLVKRPDEGLLAGLWEFPSVLLGVETNLATRRYAIDQFLKKSFNLDLKKSCTVVLREDIGQYIHVFSHIRLKMYVELLVLCLRGRKNVLHGKPESETKAWKSVDSKALSSMGLTSGVRKVFSMIQKFKQNKSEPIPGKARKRKTPSS
ncbi:adenine DNA glycosylase-like isoform X1 [Actinidia eriantha]|uniref:adenine DNA glycosylase-like isoform X1 n=2 Tax=Actinidia eriantha TaxID=165200 RepID=UPI002582D882|nr:adenine DNA glycosylase-like isoform X1 [Actinidia eriantha]XP_057513760.1 adenine DNA glycosylase-like isoform X1 [Actinidia eriantha]XP_057513761.1 adenine DNA glycosylase-like isoform X1 [Actinidia eriantha]